MTRYITWLLAFVLLSACALTVTSPLITVTNAPPIVQTLPPSNPYAPHAGDEVLSRGSVFLNATQILILETYPVQVVLMLQGNLPTPCNVLRVRVEPPNGQYRIIVEVYSLTEINSPRICAQVEMPFEVEIPLGSFSPGHYAVWVNGVMIGQFD